jgi:hypothetical protein
VKTVVDSLLAFALKVIYILIVVYSKGSTGCNKLAGLFQRGTFKLVPKSELEGNNPNIVPSRFVLAIKRKDNGEEVYKARFVLGGHRDRDKRHIVHSATNLKQSSIRILLTCIHAGILYMVYRH